MIADEVMAGFGRARRVVRGRPVGRHARPDHVRQGRQLRLRAARRRDHLRPRSPRRSRERVFPGGLTYSGHPLACAAAVASHQRLRRRGHHRARPPARRRRARPGPARDRRAPSAASARCAGSACSGRSTWSRTRRPASCWCPTTPRRRQRADGRPGGRVQGARACCRSPTSTGSTSCRRARSPTPRPRRGWPMLDEALTVADEHTGA